MSAAEPLHRTIQSIAFTDSEIRRIATLASQEANKVMTTMASKGTTSASIRSAQIAMAKVNAEMWGNVGDAVKVGIGDAVWNATEMQALYDEALFGAAGVESRYWRASMMATAQQGVESLVSRKVNGITLAQSVYKNQALSSGKIDDIINTSLALGKSPTEIAKAVVGYINPAVPGGASYAAMRLGRSEVNNAFHTTSIRRYQKTPWIELAQWNLSGSHKKPDACNDYADDVHYKGGDPGVYKVSDIPGKPHPQCLCYIEPVSPSLDDFAKAYKSGKYDSFIDGEMGCYRVA